MNDVILSLEVPEENEEIATFNNLNSTFSSRPNEAGDYALSS